MPDATIIMAGGTGTRLWPASTESTPKQFLRIGGSLSLIQQALIRAAAAAPDGPVVIVTHADHVDAIARHVAELPVKARQDAGTDAQTIPGRVVYLGEPVGRNTAPAIALGMHYVRTTLGDEATALVLTADHVIRPIDRFVHDVETAAALARDRRLVCFGVTPDRPETGYGYVKAGRALGDGREVERFAEKN